MASKSGSGLSWIWIIRKSGFLALQLILSFSKDNIRVFHINGKVLRSTFEICTCPLCNRIPDYLDPEIQFNGFFYFVTYGLWLSYINGMVLRSLFKILPLPFAAKEIKQHKTKGLSTGFKLRPLKGAMSALKSLQGSGSGSE